MNEKMRFSKYTQDLRNAFPTWTLIRKDPAAIGSQFLGVIGLKLDEIEWILEYAYKQQYIDTTDINQTDIVYKAEISNNFTASMNYRIMGGTHLLSPQPSIDKFLSQLSSSYYGSIEHQYDYYIDFETKLVYVRLPFGISEKYPKGSIELTILDALGGSTYVATLPLQSHQVWNFFDEFGLLLNTPRLEDERNYEYKQRILDVFRRPASSTYQGMINGIARELGLIQEVEWNDGGQSISIMNPRLELSSITVDDVAYLPESIVRDASNRPKLLGDIDYNSTRRIVRFVAGIELHNLHDKSDTDFQDSLFYIDGKATPLLQYYVDTVSAKVPIMWGQWKWNQGFWDIADPEMSGYGYIPEFFDAKFAAWSGYRPEEA